MPARYGSPLRFILLSIATAWGLTASLAIAATEVDALPKVVVDGVVPSEEARQAILARVREIYGAARVVDQLGVGAVAAPPNWSQNVQKMISPDLQRVTRGAIKVNGNMIELNGEVDSEASRRQVVGQLSSVLNPTYTVRDGLRVGASAQAAVDAALAGRVIEFEPGNATLTARGLDVLDKLVPVLRPLLGQHVDIVGHTDSQGERARNVALSIARAEAVRNHLQRQGIAADSLRTAGYGPDRPVASNETPEGRARNRRIELRVVP